MKRVDRIKLGHVDQIYPHGAIALDPNWLFHERMRNRVNRVNFVFFVKVRIEGIHHHQQLLPLLILGCS